MQLGDHASDADANQSAVAGHKADLLRRTEELTQEAARLKTLAVAFEREPVGAVEVNVPERDRRYVGQEFVGRYRSTAGLSPLECR
jgi:hypothetical protein